MQTARAHPSNLHRVPFSNLDFNHDSGQMPTSSHSPRPENATANTGAQTGRGGENLGKPGLLALEASNLAVSRLQDMDL